MIVNLRNASDWLKQIFLAARLIRSATLKVLFIFGKWHVLSMKFLRSLLRFHYEDFITAVAS